MLAPSSGGLDLAACCLFVSVVLGLLGRRWSRLAIVEGRTLGGICALVSIVYRLLVSVVCRLLVRLVFC